MRRLVQTETGANKELAEATRASNWRKQLAQAKTPEALDALRRFTLLSEFGGGA
ncbi:hypothetical protein [Paracidovorax citrulli]